MNRSCVNWTLGAVTSCVVLGLPATAQSAKTTGAPVSARAQAIHESAIIVDTHADTPQRFLDEGFDIGSTDPKRRWAYKSRQGAPRQPWGGVFFHLGRSGNKSRSLRAAHFRS